MRIFQSIKAAANPAVADNVTWYRNLYEPLVEMEQDVVLFDASQGRQACAHNDLKLRDKFSQQLLDMFLREHKKKPFDLFFSYFIDGMIDPEVIKKISDLGVPTCNFSCNNAHQFNVIKNISIYYDYNLHAERDVAGKFSAIGAVPFWFPMASNPRYFKPLNVNRHYDVSFVGANYATRARHISYLLENDVDVHAFGPMWKGGAGTAFRSIAKRYYYLLFSLLAISPNNQSRLSGLLAEHDYRRKLSADFPSNVHLPVSDEKLIRLYSESHISLGFLEVFNNHDPSAIPVQHVHLREFEAPMCAALYLTGYTDELSEYFDPGKEILTYRNLYEMLDKVKYYLAHPSEANKIREAGYKRALAEHTYHHRYRMLFKELGINGN